MVRRACVELRGACVHRLERGSHAGVEASRAHLGLADAPQPRELGVGETELLGALPRTPAELAGAADGFEGCALVCDGQHLVDEPRIDASVGADLVHVNASPQQLADLEDALGCRGADCLCQLGGGAIGVLGLAGVGVEAEAALLPAAQRFLQALAEGAADGHHLAHGLHLRAEHRRGAGQFLERPAGDLGDHVVDRRLEAGGGLAGDVIGDLVERVTDGEAGGDLGDREPGGLRRERRTAADPGVHLDDDLGAVNRVHGELHVRAAGLDADAPHAGKRRVPHLLVLEVGQRLGRCNRDRVAGVHAHRVEVLDGADHHAVVRVVAHHLELEFLPALHRLLDEDLADRAGVETLGCGGFELVGSVGEAGPLAAQDVGGTDDDRQSDLVDGLACLVHGVRDGRAGAAQSDLGHRLAEPVAVLRGGDRVLGGADHLDAVTIEHAAVAELGGQVERGLPAERRQQGVGSLAGDDRLEHCCVERLDIGGVGELGVGHDRGRVRVGQDHPVALLAQHTAGLGARVVELAGLADDDGP